MDEAALDRVGGRRALSNMSFEAAYTGGRTDGMLVNALLNQPLPGPGACSRGAHPQYGNISIGAG
jgi:hypothetical protein